ncbi:DNA mismatch repair endonuclease MutL [Thermodesulfitimonas sp.]
MGRIRVLDPETVGLVAAGEVVDRPASVVKELVENAFDAGASCVEVVVEKELKSITVRDNGCGIAEADVLLAFERHATSKITCGADLERITTFGFRGEALPSIAAVARVELKTRVADAVGGTLVRIEGGQVVDCRPVGAPPGTTVTVGDLFYNTPARRKFLCSPRVELGHVTDMTGRLALGRPDVAVRLESGGRELFRTPGTGLAGAVRAIYGEAVAAALVPVEAEGAGVRLTGFVGRPELVRTTRRGQTWFVNGRYVKHGGLTAAVYEAYGTLLPTGKHPFFVLHLTLDPGFVDVNVHPQKLTVRFDREREVLAFARGAVKKALFGRAVLIPGTAGKGAAGGTPSGAGFRRVLPDWLPGRGPVPGLFIREETERYGAGAVATAAEAAATTRLLPGEGGPPGAGSEGDTAAGTPGILLPGAGALPAGVAEAVSPGATSDPGAVSATFPALEYLAFLPPTYLLAAGPEGLYLIDQHAAHERVLFEAFGVALARGGIVSQLLVTPELVEVRGFAPEVAEELERFGFLVEAFGEDAVLLRGVPAGVSVERGRLLLAELLALFTAGEQAGGGPGAGREKAALASLACHAAINAGERLAVPEAAALINQLAACREPFTCPHGRPTVVCLGYGELARRFGRR